MFSVDQPDYMRIIRHQWEGVKGVIRRMRPVYLAKSDAHLHFVERSFVVPLKEVLVYR
jgi:hypothetical protein